MSVWDGIVRIFTAPFSWPADSFEALFTGTAGYNRKEGESYHYLGGVGDGASYIGQGVATAAQAGYSLTNSRLFQGSSAGSGSGISLISLAVIAIIIYYLLLKPKKD